MSFQSWLRLSIFVACVLLVPITPLRASDKKVVVGVNVVGVNQLSEAQQDSLIQQLQHAGVKTVRTGFGDDFRYFITHAYQNGISAVVIVDPLHGSKGPLRPTAPSLGLTWRQQALSDANPGEFSKWFVAQLTELEASGVRLSALELGNEVNSLGYNGDFIPAQTTGRLLGLADLNNPKDSEGQAIARGYLEYLKIMMVLKDARNHSNLNRETPVLSAGLASTGLPGRKPGWKLDGVSAPDTIAFWRNHGLDSLVDGYAVHSYPAPDPKRTVPALTEALAKDAFAACTARKPCWLTEWGFDNRDVSCPVDETTRLTLIGTMRGALKQFAAQGQLAGAIYYSWSGHPAEVGSTVFRCGELTQAGKLAIAAF